MKGFSLIELLIYIVILATILVLATSFLWVVIFGNIKESSFQEVQYNGRFALAKVRQEIQKATGIISPLTGNSANLISLQMADTSLDPTEFEVINGKLKITQGSSPPVSYDLTSDQVVVSNLKFTNLSYDNTPGIIRIEMQIDHINLGVRKEYEASISLKSSITLVPGGTAPSLEIKKPTTHTDIPAWTTPALAYSYPDTPNDQLDSGSDTNMPDRDPAIRFYNWAPKTGTYTVTVLKVNWRTNGLHSNDQFAIRYTKDGALTWQDIVPMGVHNETIIQTSLVSLDNNQDLNSVQLKVVSDRGGGADGGTLYIYDIWTEGSF